MTALALYLLAGCAQMSIDGQVVDVVGAPVAGAVVTAVGSTCQTVTGPQGRFSLPCKPGRYTVAVSAEGHHDAEQTLSAMDREPHDIGVVELVNMPRSEGLFRMVGTDFLRLDPGWLGRNADEQTKAYCLREEDSAVNTVSTGLRLYERAADDWRLFRLDEEGCAQRLVWRAGAWRVESQDPVEPERRVLGTDILNQFELTSGRYFLADWPSGRFRPDATRGPEQDKRFSGHLLIVP